MDAFIDQFKETVKTAQLLAPKNEIVAAILPMLET